MLLRFWTVVISMLCLLSSITLGGAAPATGKVAAQGGSSRPAQETTRAVATGTLVNVAAPQFGTVSTLKVLTDGDDGTVTRFHGDILTGADEEPVTISFARPFPIEAIEFFRSAKAPYQLIVEGTADGETWNIVADLTDRDHFGPARIEFQPRPLTAIRLIGVKGDSDTTLWMHEVRVLTREPYPFAGVSRLIPPQAVPWHRNLAYSGHGGTVTTFGGSASTEWVDGDPESGWILDEGDPAPEIEVSFNGGGTTAVDALAIRPPQGALVGHMPQWLEVTARRQDGSWISLGRHGLYFKSDWQQLELPSVSADRLKITLGPPQNKNTVGLNEIVVAEAEGPRESVLPFASHGYRAGLNLALSAFGGGIVRTPGIPDENPAAFLIDGLFQGEGWRTGRLEKHARSFSQDVILRLAGNRPALITKIVVDPRRAVGSFRPITDSPREIEFAVSKSGKADDFRVLGTYMMDLRLEPHDFWFAPVEARYVRLRIHSNHGGEHIALGEVQVHEALQPGYASVTGDLKINLLDRRLGGHFAVPRGENRGDLLEGGVDTRGWISEPAKGSPVAFTLAFRESRKMRFDRMVFNPKNGHDPATWARRVRVFASDHPTKNFDLVGEYEIQPEDRDQTFRFAPVEARYLQLRLLDNGGASRYSLGEVSVLEAIPAGGSSRLALGEESLGDPVTASRTPALPADLMETEPNDTLNEAGPLPLEKRVAGRIAPLSDVDHFAVDTRPGQFDTLNLTIEEVRTLRTRLELLAEDGSTLDAQPLFDRGSDHARLSWQVPLGRYVVRLSRPASSILLLIDQSGSLDPARSQIVAVTREFIEQITPDEQISIAAVSRNGEGGVIADFTDDNAELLATMPEVGKGEGSSDIYSSLRTAIERIEGRPGSKAVVLITDAEATDSHSDDLYRLWDKLAATGVKVFGIGFGAFINATDFKTYHDPGANGGQLLRNFSRATGGRYFEAPAPEVIPNIYREIADDLRGASLYRLTASVPSGQGVLNIVQTGEALDGGALPAQLGLIIDASGSMRGQLPGGGAKMEVARQVLRTVVEQLPDDIRVGVRAYGHRLPREPKLQSCNDTELIIPFGPLDRGRLMRAVDGLSPRGQTPIGLSLRELEKDFAGAEGQKVIVVITDGIETCAPNAADWNYPPMVVREMIALGLDVRVNVVGFDIVDSETRELLTAIASNGGGSYFEARDAGELAKALQQATAAPFTVFDSRNQAVATGRLGDPAVAIPAGDYRVEIGTMEPLSVDRVRIEPDRETSLILENEGGRVTHRTAIGAVRVPPPAADAGELMREQIDDPVEQWVQPPNQSSLEPSADAPADGNVALSSDEIAFIQHVLAELGYDPGPVDGALGPRARSAIADFQRDFGFKPDGEPTRGLVRLLESAP